MKIKAYSESNPGSSHSGVIEISNNQKIYFAPNAPRNTGSSATNLGIDEPQNIIRSSGIDFKIYVLNNKFEYHPDFYYTKDQDIGNKVPTNTRSFKNDSLVRNTVEKIMLKLKQKKC